MARIFKGSLESELGNIEVTLDFPPFQTQGQEQIKSPQQVIGRLFLI